MEQDWDPQTPGSLVVKRESLWISPAADLFVSGRVSIGLAVTGFHVREQADMSSSTGAAPLPSEAFSVAVAPRVGYVVPLGHGLSFWPRLSVGASYAEQQLQSVGPTGVYVARARSISASLATALVYHPHEHLLFQVAPEIGVGHSETRGSVSTDSTWLRIGAEATAGLVF